MCYFLDEILQLGAASISHGFSCQPNSPAAHRFYQGRTRMTKDFLHLERYYIFGLVFYVLASTGPVYLYFLGDYDVLLI
jgi:hypothetical protein